MATPVISKVVKMSDLSYYHSKLKVWLSQTYIGKSIPMTYDQFVWTAHSKMLSKGSWYYVRNLYSSCGTSHCRSIGIPYGIMLQAKSTGGQLFEGYVVPGSAMENNPYTGQPFATESSFYVVDGTYPTIDIPEPMYGAKVTWIIPEYYDYNPPRNIKPSGYSSYSWGTGTERFIIVNDGTKNKRYQYVGTQTINGTRYYEWSAYDQVYTTSISPTVSDTLYDVTGTQISGKSIVRSMSIDTRGTIIYLEDLNGNIGGYDYYSIQFERDADFVASYGTLQYHTDDPPIPYAFDGYYFTFTRYSTDTLSDPLPNTDYANCTLLEEYHAQTQHAMYNEIPHITSCMSGTTQLTFQLPNNIIFTSFGMGDYSTDGVAIGNKFGPNVYDNTIVGSMESEYSGIVHGNVIREVIRSKIRHSSNNKLHAVVDSDICALQSSHTLGFQKCTVNNVYQMISAEDYPCSITSILKIQFVSNFQNISYIQDWCAHTGSDVRNLKYTIIYADTNASTSRNGEIIRNMYGINGLRRVQCKLPKNDSSLCLIAERCTDSSIIIYSPADIAAAADLNGSLHSEIDTLFA